MMLSELHLSGISSAWLRDIMDSGKSGILLAVFSHCI